MVWWAKITDSDFAKKKIVQ